MGFKEILFHMLLSYNIQQSSDVSSVRGRKHLDFTSLPKDYGELWERFSKSRLDSLAGVVAQNRALISGTQPSPRDPSTGPAGRPLNFV